jgi:LCP family protein required for cell wall assembly
MEVKQKKRLSTPKKILVAVLIALVLLIVGFGLFTLIKLYSMGRNSARFVVKPTVDPAAAPTPDPGIVLASEDPDDLTQDVDASIDPAFIAADPIYVTNAIDPDVINILVMGEDAAGTALSGRSDVMLIVSYNQRYKTIKAVSVLRDTWLYIPGRNVWNRANAAYRFGGIGLTINTLNENFGLDIQFYMKTDFNNLVGIVDTLGGLDVTLTSAEIEYYNENVVRDDPITPGPNGLCHLNGNQVLAHCRNRTIGNGDWSRTERQRAVMGAFLSRARQEKDVASLTSLMYRLMDYVETNMSPWMMISMGTNLVFGSGLSTPMKGTIPCEHSWQYAYEGSMAVIHIDLEMNKEWIHKFFYGAF